MSASAAAQTIEDSPVPLGANSFDHLPTHVQGWLRAVEKDPAVIAGLEGFDNLRPYQSEAVLATAARIRKTLEPLLITLPTGAGKSWVIAALASVVQSMAVANSGKKKKVLVLAHSKELVAQNAQKMLSAGYNATIYAAGLNQKDGSGDIVFGSRQTVINAVDEFAELDYEFSAVFVDEAHSMPPQTREIIDKLRGINPNLRVIGLTATPYSLGKGYIFAEDTFRGLPPLREVHTREPYFAERVYDKCPHELIEDGYLCPPVLGDISDAYNIEGLERSTTGKFTEASNNAVFVNGQENLTRRIVAEVMEKAKTRNAVMFFAQNREHARQILSFLPTKTSALIDSGTASKDREAWIEAFKKGQLKYLVTVAALATGFDAPNVDLIATLRHTESQAFFQQIIGRGLRLSPETGKRDCLILDYAQNLAADGDLFTPVVELGQPGDPPPIAQVEVICPDCGGENVFQKAKWPDGTGMTPTGFLFYEDTQKLWLDRDKRPLAGHLGSQCKHLLELNGPDGRLTRCSYTWGAVLCPQCEQRNSHRTDFCIRCEFPLSKRARLLSLSTSRDESYSHRLVRVVKAVRTWLFPGHSANSGAPTLRVSLMVQELPYLVPAEPRKRGRRTKEEALEESEKRREWLPPGYELVKPEPFRLTAWLNPTVKHRAAQESWGMFQEYAKAHQQFANWDADLESLLKALAKPGSDAWVPPPRFLTYQTTQTADKQKTFYNLTGMWSHHPDEDPSMIPRQNESELPSIEGRVDA
ncbi:MAG: type III restriction protein res subunit [Marinobacter sp. T13-3]|nr:MAG: type III restriction protein res subunit [Marinobacter sp. T13-3]